MWFYFFRFFLAACNLLQRLCWANLTMIDVCSLVLVFARQWLIDMSVSLISTQASFPTFLTILLVSSEGVNTRYLQTFPPRILLFIVEIFLDIVDFMKRFQNIWLWGIHIFNLLGSFFSESSLSTLFSSSS